MPWRGAVAPWLGQSSEQGRAPRRTPERPRPAQATAGCEWDAPGSGEAEPQRGDRVEQRFLAPAVGAPQLVAGMDGVRGEHRPNVDGRAKRAAQTESEQRAAGHLASPASTAIRRPRSVPDGVEEALVTYQLGHLTHPISECLEQYRRAVRGFPVGRKLGYQRPRVGLE
jgi:hypothetical protein